MAKPSIANPTEDQDWSSEVGKLDFPTAQGVFLRFERISTEKPISRTNDIHALSVGLLL